MLRIFLFIIIKHSSLSKNSRSEKILQHIFRIISTKKKKKEPNKAIR